MNRRLPTELYVTFTAMWKKVSFHGSVRKALVNQTTFTQAASSEVVSQVNSTKVTYYTAEITTSNPITIPFFAFWLWCMGQLTGLVRCMVLGAMLNCSPAYYTS